MSRPHPWIVLPHWQRSRESLALELIPCVIQHPGQHGDSELTVHWQKSSNERTEAVHVQALRLVTSCNARGAFRKLHGRGAVSTRVQRVIRV